MFDNGVAPASAVSLSTMPSATTDAVLTMAPFASAAMVAVTVTVTVAPGAMSATVSTSPVPDAGVQPDAQVQDAALIIVGSGSVMCAPAARRRPVVGGGDDEGDRAARLVVRRAHGLREVHGELRLGRRGRGGRVVRPVRIAARTRDGRGVGDRTGRGRVDG